MHSFIEHYRCGHLIDLPPYHGCNATNKNGIRKLIRYEIGKQCVSPTWKCYWKKPSEIRPKYKKTIGVFYWARLYSKIKVTLFTIINLKSMCI